MAKKKKKGPAPQQKTPTRKRSTNQIVFSVVAIFMVLLMVIPLLLGLFQ